MRNLLALTLLFCYSLIATAQSGYQIRHISGSGHADRYPNGFNKPLGMGLSGNGQLLYVADSANDVVQVWQARDMIAIGVIGRGELSRPMDVALDRHGTLWVADSGNGRIVAYDISKPIARQIRTFNKGMVRPSGLAFDRFGRLLIADSGANKLLVLSNDQSVLINQIGTLGDGAAQFRQPLDVMVDGRGLIYVTDAGNHRIQIFSPNLQLQKIITHFGNTALQMPTYLASDPQQHLYIVDSQQQTIWILDAAFNPLQFIGQTTQGRLFITPMAIAVYGGNLWVSDSGRQQIMHLISAGSRK